MTRLAPLLFAFAVAASSAPGQTAPPANAPPIAFEVASIKPSPPMDPARFLSNQAHVGVHIDGARVDIGSTPLRDLIAAAYGVKPFQVSGPSWLSGAMFDIEAKLPDGATRDRVPEMLQALLADRFKMTMHRENKEHSEFNLVVAKGGPKLKEADPEPEPAAAAGEPANSRELTSDTPEGRVRLRIGRDGSFTRSGPGVEMRGFMANGMLHIEATRTTMKAFAEVLSQIAGATVVDQTELKGSYQLTLDFSMEEMIALARANGMMAAMGGGRGPVPAPGQDPASAASDPSGPSIAAIVQRYGLKLVSQKTAVDYIVIDHIEKTPTEN